MNLIQVEEAPRAQSLGQEVHGGDSMPPPVSCGDIKPPQKEEILKHKSWAASVLLRLQLVLVAGIGYEGFDCPLLFRIFKCVQGCLTKNPVHRVSPGRLRRLQSGTTIDFEIESSAPSLPGTPGPAAVADVDWGSAIMWCLVKLFEGKYCGVSIRSYVVARVVFDC